MDSVAFTRMADGTAAEYAVLGRLWQEHRDEHLADNLIALFEQTKGPTLGYKIDRYQHGLQAASRALREGADEEMVVVALLHDIADAIAPDNHSEVGAAILRPFVSEANYWLLKHHGVFQGYYYFDHVGQDRDARERYRGHPHFELTANFCEKWDQTSFDPDYDTLPRSAFEPLLRRVIAAPKRLYD
ncbi:MAG: HD domain-containing protein [Alphaproteobacteria bacterium]|jgi:predicted HD phosphohydrolase|nr:HD domain-containing protein [Alphaproteobacteria bacterium]